MTLLQEFGKFIEASYQTSFAPSTIHSARRALLDWHGALIAGADTDAASRLREAYVEELGVGQCSIAGSHKKAFSRAAAFVNGTISHIAEFDDIFRDGAYHPACPTISAAFALAESRNESIENLLLQQARKKAEKRVRYLRGSMNLEKQEPDAKFIEELIKNETEEIVRSSKLWDLMLWIWSFHAERGHKCNTTLLEF